MSAGRDARAVLGVGPDASLEQIRKAYRVRVRSLHPDHGAAESAVVHAQMAELADAYRALSARDAEPAEPDVPPMAAGRDEAGTPSSLMTRVAIAAAAALVAVWTVIFTVIAFAQSG
jgi:hypothetical protein